MDIKEGQMIQALAGRDEASFDQVFKMSFENLHP
jgi:hypothetical protein